MSKSVFGIATSLGQAERIVQQLEAQGFATSEISVLMPDTGGTRDVGHVKATKAPEGATTGAVTGGATGGVLGLLISGIPFSVSAAIGFIALFGIAVMDGIIILSQFNQLIDEGYDRMRAVIRTGELQLRPVLMTCVVAGVGLLPAAISEGIGSQVQKPLAIVVVTGMMLAPLVILITLPVLIFYFSRRPRERSGSTAQTDRTHRCSLRLLAGKGWFGRQAVAAEPDRCGRTHRLLRILSGSSRIQAGARPSEL